MPSHKIGQLVKAQWKWQAKVAIELSFAKGDMILGTKTRTQYAGQWEGEKVDGTLGVFPSNYVRIIASNDLTDFLTRFEIEDRTGKELLSKRKVNLTNQAHRIIIAIFVHWVVCVHFGCSDYE